MSYDGFISYSHAADGELAPALQEALQRMAKPWYRRRALAVFRDETGLSVDPHLWGAIEAALEQADWFVLLTSPQAAGSTWVNREIEHWVSRHGVDRILPVVTGGRWAWDPETGDFTPDSDAVPDALRGVFDGEPRHLDLSWAHEEQQLNLRNGRFRDAAAELAAPMHGRTKDEIEGEDVRQHRRTIRTAWGAAAALAVLSVVAIVGAVLAVRNANSAERRRVEAESQRLVAQSGANLDRPDLAFLLAAHADRLDPSLDTQGAVLSALAARPDFRQRLQLGTPVSAVALDTEADLVAVGTVDGDVELRSYSTGEPMNTAAGVLGDEVTDLRIVGGGDDLRIVAADIVSVVVLDADGTEQLTRTDPTGDPFFSMDVEESTGRVAAGTGLGNVVVWEADSVEPFASFEAHAEGELTAVDSVAWAADGTLLSAGQDGAVRRWDLEQNGEPVWELDYAAEHPGATVQSLAALGEDRFVTGGSGGLVRFWNQADGTPAVDGAVPTHTSGVTQVVATGAEPDDGSVASVSGDGTIVYWNDRTGFPFTPILVHEGSATGVAWDAADPQRGVTGGEDGTVLLLNYGPDGPVAPAEVSSGWSEPSAASLSPDGSRLAVAQGTSLVLTDADQPDPSSPSVEVGDVVEQARVTTDNLVVAGLSDGSIVTWDGDGAAVVTEAHDGAVTQLAVSPDGTTVASGAVELDGELDPQAADAGSTLRLWTVGPEGALRPTDTLEVPLAAFGLEFFDDGRRLAIGGQQAFAVADLDTGEVRRAELDFEATRAIAPAPDGETLAVALGDGSVRVYDVATLTEQGASMNHPARVTGAAFAGEGRLLVTVAADGGLRFWDVASRRALAPPFRAHPAGAGPSLSVVGERAATTVLTGDRVAVWPLSVERQIQQGCRRHGRDLTEVEAERFDLVGAPRVCPD
ncbi:MAG: TIR domain-containing protein [Microthrixaceae bacterium]